MLDKRGIYLLGLIISTGIAHLVIALVMFQCIQKNSENAKSTDQIKQYLLMYIIKEGMGERKFSELVFSKLHL